MFQIKDFELRCACIQLGIIGVAKMRTATLERLIL